MQSLREEVDLGGREELWTRIVRLFKIILFGVEEKWLQSFQFKRWSNKKSSQCIVGGFSIYWNYWFFNVFLFYSKIDLAIIS
jgi:hypothetical protein